ncbi:hypothetical protein DAPPUDRAFT_233567 [Daphnia pulex]|uniref:Uncharacterized protein n=1 Tax=Daphnia pulex TaxID=6669 RepID=E9FV53_DAPPU|nr:hypothetical protein DAPPUDRAFT_233567 [Daphnia pulex]|eukprot:EFX89167.1 hypothetical protein DAPPUDRAFT_233567 [Daphnia pulex]
MSAAQWLNRLNNDMHGKHFYVAKILNLSRRSSKTTPSVKHTNVVLLSETANRSPSNWLSGTTPSKVSLLNNFYVDPYYEPVRAEKQRLSGLIDSLDVSENAYVKWEQGTDLFMVENSHPSPPSSVKAKRRRPQALYDLDQLSAVQVTDENVYFCARMSYQLTV